MKVISAPQHKVLVVDDDELNLQLISQILARENCDYRVTSDSTTVLEILKGWTPDLLILDQDMPKMTGMEVLQKVRPLYPDLDIIFISAHSSPRLASQVLEAGANDYVRKPFSVIELVSRLHVRFRIRELVKHLKVANEKLEDLAIKDELTGLFNMRSIFDKIEYELKRSKRSERPVACVMFDMDHFKTVNDEHDHLFGSFVLKETGRLLKESLRETDFAARYGGDEFLAVLTETDDRGAEIFCQRFLQKIRGHVFKDKLDQISLTVSLGYSVADHHFSYEAKDFVRAADHALYLAKENGRNQVKGFDLTNTMTYLKDWHSRKAA